MPEEEIDLSFLGDEEEIFPRNVNEVFGSRFQKRAAEAAKVQTNIPSPSAALGRQNIINDILRLMTFPLGEAVNLALGDKPLPQKLIEEQSAPSFKPLTVGDIGAVVPDIVQGVTTELGGAIGGAATGAVTGGSGAFAGALAGRAGGSIAGSKLSEGMREFSPEMFGDTPGNINFGGMEIPAEEFNLMMDAGIPLMGTVGSKLLGRQLKQRALNSIVRKFGDEAPEDIANAYLESTNLAKELEFNVPLPGQKPGFDLPRPTVGSFSKGTLKNIEDLAAGEALHAVRKENEERHVNALMRFGGLNKADLEDRVIPGGLSQEVSSLPQRRGIVRAPSGPQPQKQSVVRGLELQAKAGRVRNWYQGKATEKYQYVRDNLVAQGDTTIPISGDVRERLISMHDDIDKLIVQAPDLSGTYSGIKQTIENILELPKVSRKISATGDTITQTEKIVTKPKTITTTTGTKKVIQTPEAKVIESSSETFRDTQKEAGKFVSSTEAVSKTEPILREVEQNLPTGIDYDTLVKLNSSLKKSLSNKSGQLPVNFSHVQGEMSKVVQEIDKNIVEELTKKQNGKSLADSHKRGSAITSLRYKRFTDRVDDMIEGGSAEVFDKIIKDPEAANSFAKASGNRSVAQQEIAYRIIQKSYDKEGNFNPRLALNFFTDPSNAGINNLYTPKQKNAIEQFLKVSSAVTRDPSHIGQFAVIFKGANTVMALSSFSAIANPSLATPAIMWFGGRHFIKEIMLNPDAAKIATGLLKMPAKSPRAISEMRRLLPYLNGVKVTVNMGNQSFETEIDSNLLSKVRFARPQAPNPTYDLLNQVRSVQGQGI